MRKNYQNESGRSMVEMLGVLAIVGVLSVAGIAGYTAAMNQYRANEAINTAVQLAMMVSAQRLTNPNATVSTSDFGANFSVDNSETGEIKITLSNLPEAVRKKIQNMGFKNATPTSGEGDALVLTFNNDLSERNLGGNSGQGQQQADPCAGVDCNSGTCSGGVCDCTGTGYTGEYCETENEPVLTCNNNADNTVTDNTNTVVGYCKPLGGCKFNELSSPTNWMQLCNYQLPPSAYLCYLGKIYNRDGELVKNCTYNICSTDIDTPPIENMCGTPMSD